jgi:hypothetical protein
VKKSVEVRPIYIIISTMKTPLVLLALALFSISVMARPADMPAGGFAGTWKVNFAKSKFPGPPPQVDMAIIDPDGTVTVHEINSEGKSINWHYKPIEGQAVPVIGRDNTTVTVRRLDSHTTEHIWNFNGRAAKSKAVLSNDGKTTTFTIDGIDKDGKPFHEMVVYDKQ